MTDQRGSVGFSKDTSLYNGSAEAVVVQKLKRKRDNWILRAMNEPELMPPRPGGRYWFC
jgi:hypothetical protein